MIERAGFPVLAGVLLVQAVCNAALLPAMAAQPADAVASVVTVKPQWPGRPPTLAEPEASGVVVLDGRKILTAYHVIRNAENILIRTHKGRILPARVLGRDRATDLALLSVEQPLKPFIFAGDAKLGARACAIGNAFGIGLSLTCGIVSGVHKAGLRLNPIEDFVQTDASVNPGSSGGALVDGEGRLIGVLSAIFTKKSDTNAGVNFAVSAPLAKRIAEDLARDGRVVRYAPGLVMMQYPLKGAPGQEAALVRHVREGLPAYEAGIRVGDRIMKVAGRRIRKPNDFSSAIARLRPGARIEVELISGATDKPATVTMTLGPPNPRNPDNPR